MTRRLGLLLFAALALLAAALHPGVVDNVDSRIVLRTAERLVDAGTWSLGDVEGTYLASPEYGARGPDGSHQMKFGAGNALLAVPPLLAGRAVLVPLGLDPRRAGEAGVAFASALWFAASGLLVFRIARRVATDRVALGAALLHAVASYALVYGRSAYLETPLTVFTLLAFDAALAARAAPADPRPAFVLGLAAGAAVWIKLTAVLLLLGVVPVLLTGGRDARRDAARVAARAAVPVALLVGALLWLNHARFGDAFATGYSGSARFDHPLLAGTVALFLSERGGLLFFAPCALAGIAGLARLSRTAPGLAAGIALATVAAVPLYARFFSPFGGDAWGPRYLVPNAALLAVPAAVALADLLRAGPLRRGAAAGIVAAGCTLQVAPSLVSFTEVWTHVRATRAAPHLGPVAASLLAAKLRPGGGRLDLWPNRVAKDLPRRATLAWTCWTAVAGGAAACGVALALRARRLPA